MPGVIFPFMSISQNVIIYQATAFITKSFSVPSATFKALDIYILVIISYDRQRYILLSTLHLTTKIFVPRACVVFTLLQVTHHTPKCVSEPVLTIYSRYYDQPICCCIYIKRSDGKITIEKIKNPQITIGKYFTE